MRLVNRYLVYVAIFALVCLIVSLFLLKEKEHVLGGADFWGNLLLNLSVELLGLILTTVVGVKIATMIARERLNKPARRFLKLLAHLRIGKTISGEAARQSVRCVVSVISEEHLLPKHTLSLKRKEVNCGVCALTVQTIPDKKGQDQCEHCGLVGDVWKDIMDDDKF
jgi:hypothetical protein